MSKYKLNEMKIRCGNCIFLISGLINACVANQLKCAQTRAVGTGRGGGTGGPGAPPIIFQTL